RASFDLMVTRLTDRLPLDSGIPQARTGRVMILSGDVHSSYASRLGYWADKRYGDSPGTGRPCKAAFAQLVASPFKNASKATLGQHKSGYHYAPYHATFMLPTIKPEGVFGWALDRLSAQAVEIGKVDITTTVVGIEVSTTSVT